MFAGVTHTDNSGSAFSGTHDTDYGSIQSDSSFENEWRHKSESSDEDIRKEIYKRQDEDLSILEDMIQMHSVNKDADLESHYGGNTKSTMTKMETMTTGKEVYLEQRSAYWACSCCGLIAI